MAAPFDIKRLAVTGEAVPVVEGVLQPSLLSGAAQYSFSNTGSLIYPPASGSQRRCLHKYEVERFHDAPSRVLIESGKRELPQQANS